jgi:hypothetical protein
MSKEIFSPETLSSGLRIAMGQHTTGSASDEVVTGLNKVLFAIASMEDDPVDGAMDVTAMVGNQTGTPPAGSILIKSWKSTDGDASYQAASTASKKVNWLAFGS